MHLRQYTSDNNLHLGQMLLSFDAEQIHLELIQAQVTAEVQL